MELLFCFIVGYLTGYFIIGPLLEYLYDKYFDK